MRGDDSKNDELLVDADQRSDALEHLSIDALDRQQIVDRLEALVDDGDSDPLRERLVDARKLLQLIDSRAIEVQRGRQSLLLRRGSFFTGVP